MFIRLAGKYKSEAGITLVDSLVATAILGLIAVAFLSGVATMIRADYIASERAIAEALARNQVETIKTHTYIDFAYEGHDNYTVATAPADYTVEVVTSPINSGTGEPLAEGLDQGVQKITITVKHHIDTIVTLASYKVDR